MPTWCEGAFFIMGRIMKKEGLHVKTIITTLAAVAALTAAGIATEASAQWLSLIHI